MTKNNIRLRFLKKGISQTEAANQMPDDVGRVGMSFIATGRVLPTKDGLEALCKILDCTPADLYDPSDLDLLSAGSNGSEQPSPPNRSRAGSQHDGMLQLRAWLRPYEKDALETAVQELGYRSVSEWLREMIRNTVARNKRLQPKPPAKAV